MDLEEIKKEAEKEIKTVKDIRDLENWRIKYLGRKSDLSLFFDNLKKLSLEQRKKEAQKCQATRLFLTELFKAKEKNFPTRQIKKEYFDISQPGTKKEIGHLHPISSVLKEIVGVFQNLGFEIVEGPEIETEYYNFDALRIPENHPARDMWDTLWIKPAERNQKERLLLRTHTSPMQIRYMEKHEPPFRIIVPGKTFRHEATDTSHEIQFHQVEGLMVSEVVSFSNFKFIIEEFLKAIFKDDILIRFRPSYFPFVTPGVEVDIKINSKGNRDKWLEIMGAGMVHPDLYKTVGYRNKNLQGFAFGVGVERIAMIKYKISDIRLFASSDIRFLRQF